MLEHLRVNREAIIGETVTTIAGEIPNYGADPVLLADVEEHVRKHHEALLEVLSRDEAPTREDLLFTRRHTAARVGRIPIADYLHAFRIYLDVVWRAVIASARSATDSREALALVGRVLDYVNLATTYAAELYIEIEQLELAGGDRVRRDLLEDLVAGRPVPPGPRQDAARAAGLGPSAACLVVVATPRGAISDEQHLRSAASALARACRAQVVPLTVLLQDEIVVVAPARDAALDRIVAGLGESQAKLAQQGARLAVGVSTVQPGLSGVEAAYREARGAAGCLGPDGGVLALPSLSAFDYLISFPDATAERLVAPRIREFVREDVEHGGVLTSTALAYVECDLNVKAMAQRLYIHTNTAHHRLHRIEEQTGLDLRRLGDVLQLVVAIRIAQPLGDRPPGAWT